MGRAIDLFVTYRFIKLLVTPFDKTEAFKLGIIDEKGNEEMINYADLKSSILNSEKLKFNDQNEKLAYLNSIIQETVNYHQVSDVPRTVLLSSGVDSNIILSSINENNKKT